MPSMLDESCDERVHRVHAGPWYGRQQVGAADKCSLPAPAQKGFPKVPSMLFDMEMEDSLQHGHTDDHSSSLHDLRRFLMPLSTGEYKLRAEVEAALEQQQLQQQQQHPDQQVQQHQQHGSDAMLAACHKLATQLSKKGYHVHVRTALGGGEGFDCLRNLRHVFLTVLPPGGHASTNRYIVDLSFKEQFRVAKPTPRYHALLECLPEVYVAPESMVGPLVHLMCQEMAIAFHANGAVLPPWRESKAMITRWNPRKSFDLSFPPLPATTAAPCMAMPASQHKVLPPAPGPKQQQQQEVRVRLQQALDAAVMQAVGKQQQAAAVVKPIACEPQRVVVGGNFASIGFQ